MAKIQVPRAEVCELLGLPADVDEATLQRTMAEAVGRQKSREALSANEQEARAVDRRLVNAAYNDGRIVNRDNWINALAADRAANRALLASLASGLPPAQQVVVDPELEQVHSRVFARLGIQQAPQAPQTPRTVAASLPPLSTARPVGAPGEMRDSLGLPIPDVPAPVRLVRGKDPARWTQQERDDAALWALGPAFRNGLKPPPGGAAYYHPSPNDVASYDESTGEWMSKDGWERGTHGIGI